MPAGERRHGEQSAPVEAERVKMALSEGETEEFHLSDPASGRN